MNSPVKKVVLAEQQSSIEPKVVNKNYLNLVNDIEVECLVRVGTLNLTIAELKTVHLGQVLNLLQQTNEPVELLLHNKVFAKGELMSHEEHFAVRITEICC